MGGYLARQLLGLILVLLLVSLVVFSMLQFLPGDPVRLMMAESGGGTKMANTGQDTYTSIRHELGLDLPLPVQYARYVWKAVHGDLGRSWRSNQTVTAMIVDAIPSTLRLALAGLGVAIPVGVLLGVIAALRHNSWIDNLSMLGALFAVSMPSFWLGIMLVLVFAVYLNLLPALSFDDPRGIILPAITLGLSSAAIIARLTRSSLLEVMSLDYITTARAKGLAGKLVVWRHALKNALIPVVTVVGLQFGTMLSGAIVIETVFARPGLGRLLVDGINGKDFPVVQGGILVTASVYVVASLLVDLAYAFIDPRISFD